MPEDIAEAMSDNEALRRILASQQAMEQHLKQEYDEIETTADIALNTSSETLIRAAEPDSVATVIVNRSSNDAHILEDGKQVATVKALTSQQLPLTAKGELKGLSVGGATTVRASTYILN